MKVKRILDKRAAVTIGLSFMFLTLSTCIRALAVKKYSIRRFGVRPMNRKRLTEGIFATLIKDMLTLEWDEEQFIKYTRMTKAQFLHLHHLVFPQIKKSRKKYHIPTQQRLVMTLHYLSEGCSMQEIGWNYRTGKTTARNIIKETCEAIWNVLCPIVLPIPTVNDFNKISKEFFNLWNVPNCIGAVDGKHVVIQAPKKSGSEFFNYKQSFSIVLMASCDAYYRFTMVDIGASGGNHDSAVFKQSGFGRAFMNNELDIPPVKPLPNTNILMPHFVVADAAFPLHNNIIRPYPGNHLGFADYIGNNGEVHPGSWRESPTLKSLNRLGSNNATNAAKNQRDRLADYFISEHGMVHWQENYVNRGGLPIN